MNIDGRLVQAGVILTTLLTTTGCALPWLRVETMLPEGPLANFRAEPTGKRGTPVPITVFVSAADGCVQAGWANAEVDESQRTVTVRGAAKRVNNGNALCTTLVHYPSITTSFTPQNAGTYTVKSTIVPDLSAEGSTGGYSHLQPKLELDFYSDYGPIEATQTVVISE